MANYSHPEVLCETDWVASNLKNANVRILEVDYDPENAYRQGHVPGAHRVWWKKDINDPVRRDIISKQQFEALMSRVGATADSELVMYGDFNNWFAAFAFWVFQYYGHKNIKLMNGGRKKWELEKRELVTEKPAFPRSNYPVPATDETIRAYRREVEDTLGRGSVNLVDVRSPDEYTGKVIAPPGMTETAQRGGHIPGAKNIPWGKAANDDGTFKNPDDLRRLYADAGWDANKPTIAYCRIGERSSHTWFVL